MKAWDRFVRWLANLLGWDIPPPLPPDEPIEEPRKKSMAVALAADEKRARARAKEH
jgi:hypothetical protein